MHFLLIPTFDVIDVILIRLGYWMRFDLRLLSAFKDIFLRSGRIIICLPMVLFAQKEHVMRFRALRKWHHCILERNAGK